MNYFTRHSFFVSVSTLSQLVTDLCSILQNYYIYSVIFMLYCATFIIPFPNKHRLKIANNDFLRGMCADVFVSCEFSGRSSLFASLPCRLVHSPWSAVDSLRRVKISIIICKNCDGWQCRYNSFIIVALFYFYFHLYILIWNHHDCFSDQFLLVIARVWMRTLFIHNCKLRNSRNIEKRLYVKIKLHRKT